MTRGPHSWPPGDRVEPLANPTRIVTLSAPVDTSTTSVWEYPDGSVRILVRGYAAGTATNTDDDISVTHNGGFRSEVLNPS